ncbi:M20 family peptidase [Piscinibacter sp. XHJ-5]|uniref:M20 family peptidase n=1 Tax=Piscinibacter sp. XHJ-5 TaxID=3037797 RepID=UPI0024533FF4|nr:M20 family peptidase [Piscinibacter sp. XHJ-5]
MTAPAPTDRPPATNPRTTPRRLLHAALGGLALSLAILVGVLLASTWSPAPTTAARVAAALPVVDEPTAATRLAGALRFQTISHQDRPDASAAAFVEFHAYLERTFPLVHARLQRERVGGYSLLYTWRGTDDNAPAVLLMAHQDVVPVSPGTDARWTHPPFAGTVADGFMWGRGSWDDKGRLMAQLEAVEAMLRDGARPARTVFLAFGHDEEVGGTQGAKAIATLLRSRGVKLLYSLDEGMVVTDGIIAGARRPVALVGVAEKGYVAIRLRATADAGHSSMPPRRGAIGNLSRAIAALEAQPMPARLQVVASKTFTALAPDMSLARRVVLSNLWLFAPLLERSLEQSPVTDAMLRTTTAVTIVRGGDKENVLPGAAEAIANFRLLPGDRAQEVLDHVRRVVANHGVEVELLPQGEPPSAVSPLDSDGYRGIARSIEDVFGDVAVAPGLVVGGTDSKHLGDLTDKVYRFSPVRVRPEDTSRIHGSDERLSVSNYAEMIRFYQRLLYRTAVDSSGRAPARD